MFAAIRRSLLRPALLGALLVTMLTLAAPAALAAPKDPVPPIPSPTPPPAYAPDLVVESLRYGSTYFSIGKYYYVDATIRNQGNLAAGEFWVKNDAGFADAYRQVNGLAAGSFITVRFYRTNCESGGTIIADIYGQVSEFSESNNRRAWLLIC